MYQIVLGKVSTLSAGQLPDALIAQAPQGVRRASWLAGRVLLSRALSPLPEMVYGEQGKPAFPPERRCGLTSAIAATLLLCCLATKVKSAAILK